MADQPIPNAEQTEHRLSYAERTAGCLAHYRLPVSLTPAEEREAFEQGVADEVALEGWETTDE